MEKFKAVEKAMKTKAYSKEGLSAAAKLDPKEQAKIEAGDFLSSMVDELEQQIEALEAEGEAIQATMKKGKGQSAKVERMAQIERIIERHKFHQGKLELIRRSLENGGVETDEVTDLEESIRYYVTDGMNDDYVEDETMYDDLDLQEEEDAYGMNQENDKGSSQDNQSIQDDVPEPEPKPLAPLPGKTRAAEQATGSAGRRPSTQHLKSPLPSLATIHNPLSSGSGSGSVPMKPASLPARPAGEGLKYASAAAAAAASDKNNVGISPLPPPPSSTPVGLPTSLPVSQHRTSATNSPSAAPAQPVPHERVASTVPPTTSAASASGSGPGAPGRAETKSASSRGKAPVQPTPPPEPVEPQQPKGRRAPTPTLPAAVADKPTAVQTNGVSNGIRPIEEEEEEEESIYHLPESLRDLAEAYEVTKRRPPQPHAPSTLRMLALSSANKPTTADSEPPRKYITDDPFQAHAHFPQEPLPIFDDPRLYAKIDPDTLFYVFYYKQGTYQQYLAAKALKEQSWRFHKQYQTWFQRHEEPKSITEEFEQGTYRFFDYESTW